MEEKETPVACMKHLLAGNPVAKSGALSLCMSLGSCHSIERDYYEILGVQHNASREEIKKAYHAVSGSMKSNMKGM